MIFDVQDTVKPVTIPMQAPQASCVRLASRNQGSQVCGLTNKSIQWIKLDGQRDESVSRDGQVT